MKKSILDLSGVQVLGKKQQQSINGGVSPSCMGPGWICYTDPDDYSRIICELNGTRRVCYCCSLVPHD